MTSAEDPVKLDEEIDLDEIEVPPEHALDAESGKVFEEPVKQPKKSDAKFPMRDATLRFACFKQDISFNPAVSLIGFIPLWTLAIYCVVTPDVAGDTLSAWFDAVIEKFTWFYIMANPVLTFFVVWVAYRFGDIKLGPKDAEPEFSNAAYFAMIFSAGVGVGLFFYGVSEPLWHVKPDNYFSNAGYRSQNEIDQYSLIITLYHWGFAGWSPYLVVAIACGLASFRFGLPFTIRSTFYPIFGEYCWGWIGDTIDGYSIVMTVAGVCTSLGLGTIQIIAGIQGLGWVDEEKEDLTVEYIILVCVITLAATISVVTGLSVGIKFLANLAFHLGNLIVFLCFAMEKTTYLLNLLVQTTGVYLQYNIFKVPFWTDAFGALDAGEGRATDGNSSASWFIGAWTVFYMAWWVAWACFVGMFVARISKNRTIREVVVSVFVCPTVYALIWFSFMGGIALRQQRQALELQQIGKDSFQDPDHFVTEDDPFCYNVPQGDITVNETVVFTNTLPGVTPVCLFDSDNDAKQWFKVMDSYSYPDSNGFGGFGTFLSGLTIFTLAIYFITSSDSGSLVVDMLSSNGASEHHWSQRVFWAFTEGAVAMALLVAGGSTALRALQSASIVFGLPFNLFLIVMCSTIVQMCKTIEKEQNSNQTDASIMLPKETECWSMPVFGGVFNIFEAIFSLGIFINKSRIEKGMYLPTMQHVVQFLVALIFPFVSLYEIYSSAVVDPKQKNKFANILMTAIYASCFIGWIVLFCFTTVNHGFTAFGWAAFFINACILTVLRMNFRNTLGIHGNFVGDFVASSFLYPQALCQMVIELQSERVAAFVEGTHDE